MEVTHGRGYVYSIQYHTATSPFVWCVKYRHKILTLKIENRLTELLYQIARENDFQIIECNTDKDHIHILINCKPQHYIPDIVQKMKGITSRILMKENREVLSKKLWGGHIWNPSYFISTVSENTEDQIRKYIKNQKKR